MLEMCTRRELIQSRVLCSQNSLTWTLSEVRLPTGTLSEVGLPTGTLSGIRLSSAPPADSCPRASVSHWLLGFSV